MSRGEIEDVDLGKEENKEKEKEKSTQNCKFILLIPFCRNSHVLIFFNYFTQLQLKNLHSKKSQPKFSFFSLLDLKLLQQLCSLLYTKWR